MASSGSRHVADPPGQGQTSKPPARNTAKERQRVSRACDFCKEKKIRCNGLQPCSNCTGLASPCLYKTPYMRGRRRRRNPERSNDTETSSPLEHPSRGQVLGSTACDEQINTVPSNLLSSETNPYAVSAGMQSRPYNDVSSSRNSPELATSNKQGHIVGSSSGLNFLLRLQRRLRPDHDGSLGASIDTFGDAPLPPFDDLSFMLPSKSEAIALLATYFDLASPTYRFLHRQTAEYWLQRMYSDLSISDSLSNSQRAVVLTIFAQATRYIASTSSGTNAASGMKYYQAADRLLARPNAWPDLTTGQALLGCCFYVLSCSRLNHCWSLFGTTSRLVMALGLHRKTSNQRDSRNHVQSYVDLECRKRVFWCAYNLDKYISAIMGRPSVFHDEDIDQERPTIVEDADITSIGINSDSHASNCTMIGQDMHVRLGRILSRVLRQLYGITSLPKERKYTLMSKLGEEVNAWREQLPAFLNPEKVDSRVLTPLFQRQSNLLSMAYSHVVILIFRSCLFERGASDSNQHTLMTKQNVEQCRSAALLIVDTVDKMVEAKQLYAGSWFTHYHAFCAVVILYTYTLRNRTQHPQHWLHSFRSAERCQGWISSIGGPDTLAYRFCLVMEEYRLEVLRQLQFHSPYSDMLAAENMIAQQPTPLDSTSLSTSAAAGVDDSIWNTDAGAYSNFENDNTAHSVNLSDFEQLYSLALDFT